MTLVAYHWLQCDLCYRIFCLPKAFIRAPCLFCMRGMYMTWGFAFVTHNNDERVERANRANDVYFKEDNIAGTDHKL